jgi:glycosyltransferase involved in cell wall biosynthesis
MGRLTLQIASSVGGGPMERLAARLRDVDVDARVVASMAPETWRRRLAAGRVGRLVARADAFVRFPLTAVASAMARGNDVVVPTTNPFFLPWLLVATRPLHGRTVIALIYDLYPDAVEAAGLTAPDRPLSRLAAHLNRALFRHADGVVFIGQRMADQAIARYGAPRRVAVLPTGADTAEFGEAALGSAAAESELEAWCDGHVVASYVGALGHMHDWETLAAAGRALFAGGRVPGAPERPLGLVIAASGPGVDELRRAWADLPAAHVRFAAPLADRAWARLLRRSDIALATLRPAAHRTSMPSKAQSAIAAGAALVAVAVADSDLGELAASRGVGVRVEPGDAPALAAALEHLAADPAALAALQQRARAVALASYDLPALAQRWSAFIDSVRAARAGAPAGDPAGA